MATVLVGMLFCARAEAYPYFQLSSETRTCNQCHYAPAGGGLLTNWGREEAGDTVSRGGNGAFLHGAVSLPTSFQLGGDFRVALLANDAGSAEGTELAAFPMQADVTARIAFGDISIVGTLGLRGQVRAPAAQPDSTMQEASALSRLVSREHYVYWRPKATGPYARAGRFFTPFGLRLPDHTTYVQRTLGYNLLEETYGVSGGFVKAGSELHVTAFISDPIRWAPRKEVGGAALYELHSDAAAYGVSARASLGDSDTRIAGALHGRFWFADSKILLQAQVAAVMQNFVDVPNALRWQLVAYAGPTWNPTQGLYVGLAYELFDEDLVVKNVERHAISSQISFLPTAHVEIILLTRAQFIGASDRALTGMLQLHYYL